MKPALLTLALLAPEPTPAPLPAEKAAREMVLPPGFRATVFAAEPMVVQPISFCTDHRGRIWVAEAMNYGTWQATGRDRIAILEDVDGDGRADKRTLFFEGLNYVTGIEVGFGGVWVTSPPGLYFIPDRNGDDKPDGPPEMLFDGFGYKESRHNLVNGFTWGPDGWLYGGHGRTSPSDVGRPGTPPQDRIHCDGGVYRIHPTRLVFENVADGTTNPWGVDFDDYGQCFVSNCVNPHLFHMIPGGHYEPWRNRPSSLYAYERLPTIADHLHYPGGDIRGVLGKQDTLDMGGGHAHCGTMIYLGDRFPAQYRNTVFMCNVHGRRINNDILKRKGSGYVASHGKDFAISADPWFMGVTLRTGHDGNVFVSDWSDTGECHTLKPNKETGRIYKISYGDEKAKPVDLSKLSDKELVELHLHKNDWYVRMARRLLQERYTTGEPGVEIPGFKSVVLRLNAILDSNVDTTRRLRALWTLHAIGDPFARRLNDRDEYVRAWSIQFFTARKPLEPGDETHLVRYAAFDRSAIVRLYLASLLQHIPFERRWAFAHLLVKYPEDASDPNLPLMYWYGIEPLVPLDPARTLEIAQRSQIPIVRQFIARRVVDDAAAKGDKADLAPLIMALTGLSDESTLDILKGAREGVRGRKRMPMPANWPTAYAKLSKSSVPAIREHALVLALVFGDPQALADLRRIASDASAKPAERVAALEALIENRAPDLAPLLHELLTDKATRRTALRGLAAYPDAATAAKILAVYPDLTPDEKQDAIATLASRKDSALALLDAVEKKAVPRGDVSAFAARQMYALGDAKVNERLKQVWGEVRDTAPQKVEALKKYKALLTPALLKNADLKNGKELFAKACGQCHKLHGEGGTIGPDLTGSNRGDLDYLLSNLIDPSSEVAADYRMSVVRTKDDRVITGIVLERSKVRLVVQTATEKVTLSPDDVDSVKESALSIMPENQLDALSKEQVRDLIGYMQRK